MLLMMAMAAPTAALCSSAQCSSALCSSAALHRVPPLVRAPEPRALGDGAIVAAAAALAAGAGLLQYSVSAGDQGLNAFLGKEKAENPFYQKNFKPAEAEVPQFLQRLRMPKLPFAAERATGAPSSSSTDVSALYRALDEAIEREAYDEAKYYKDRIDSLIADQDQDS